MEARLVVPWQRKTLGWLVADRSDTPADHLWGFSAFSRQPPNPETKLRKSSSFHKAPGHQAGASG